MKTSIFVNGFSGTGKTSFIKKFIHSCRGKSLVVINIQEKKSQEKQSDIHTVYSDSDYHEDRTNNKIYVYQVESAKDEIDETLDKIQEDVYCIEEKVNLFIFDGGDVDRYLSIDINVFVMEPLPENMNLYTLKKIFSCSDDVHAEICKKVGIDPKRLSSILPKEGEEIEEFEEFDEESMEEEIIEISDEQAKKLALIFNKAVLDNRLQEDFWPLKTASVIIINKFKKNTQAEVDHTLQEITNMLDKENVYKKPSIFVCDLSESKQESQVKAFNRIKRLIRKNREINSIFRFGLM